MIPFAVVFVGLFCIFIEFYLPGGIMAAIGSLALLAGIVLYADQTDSLISLAAFIFGTGIAVALTIRFALRRIVRTKSENSFYSGGDQSGFFASSYDARAIGKTGIVLSDLKPGGFILIDGKQQSAISISGYIAKGQKVKVLSGQEQSLMVVLDTDSIVEEANSHHP